MLICLFFNVMKFWENAHRRAVFASPLKNLYLLWDFMAYLDYFCLENKSALVCGPVFTTEKH